MDHITPSGQLPATVRAWTDILARIRFGTVRVAGKSYSAARIKLVAHRLATYADSDGTRIHPGIARLATDLEIDYRAARDVLSLLRRLGLITLVRPATGRGRADEYRLTLPTDLLDRDDLTVWSPTTHTDQVQQTRAAHRGGANTRSRTATPAAAPKPQGPQAVAPTDHTQDPQDPASARNAEPSRTAEPASAEPTGTAPQWPEGHATHQDLDTTLTAQPLLDPPTAGTLSRANGRHCRHGLSAARRKDGRPACTLCRIAESRPAVQ
ncbi:LAGLIDADG family homing endonuclease [Actinoplanes sp. DH11]|uniref:LAGLIDADG family homing endonuclease n=1 Tax=Actinoplanes sp. DH11 TaxID=2857011 RepID=UPI001E30F895|nr:LAGLIDADG family homing endonuclease [Actinoplanes sp. DH11]